MDGHSLELELGLTSLYYARMEVVSPLGVRLALLQVNQEWVQLYMIADKTVFRFPTSEFFKDTERRERFLNLLPVKIIPELFFDAVLNRLALGTLQDFTCRYDGAENVYWLRVVEEGGSGEGRILEIDPSHYYPFRIHYFAQKTPSIENFEKARPLYRVDFASSTGMGFSTLQSQITIFDAKMAPKISKILRFEWIRAEAWENPPSEAFQWRPDAALSVKDF